MENERRKRPASGGDDGRKARPRSEGGQTATEEEVEEFFAILRRIHAAAKYFGKGKASGGAEAEKGSSGKWRPTFRWEDFRSELGDREGDGGAAAAEGSGEKGRGKTRVVGSLDLNAEPDPESHSS